MTAPAKDGQQVTLQDKKKDRTAATPPHEVLTPKLLREASQETDGGDPTS